MSEADYNVIPPITDPLGQYWEQPPREATFQKLPVYDRSMPSGVYAGKMWSTTYRNGTRFLGWYSRDEKAGMLTMFRPVLILKEAGSEP